MDRNIKFRAYIKPLGWIGPVQRICFDTETVEVDLTGGQGDTSEYDFDEIELMQYTGVKDKNEIEIYEKDIVEVDNDWYFEIGRALYDKGGFLIADRHDFMKELINENSTFKILGNVYKDPELLEETMHKE